MIIITIMGTPTGIIITIIIIMTMISGTLELGHRTSRELGAHPLPLGERVGVRGLPAIERPKPLTPPLSQPKSDISDFGHSKVPNSDKPEFGSEREQTEPASRESPR
jgi:hypothetical protein